MKLFIFFVFLSQLEIFYCVSSATVKTSTPSAIKFKRDLVLEKVVSQAWGSVDISNGNDFLETLGGTIDPLNISKILPGGYIHVERGGDYYEVDLWLMNIVLHGLSQIYLRQVQILRSIDLKEMEIAVEFGMDNLKVDGMYNATGYLGTDWLQLPMDSEGDRPFEARLLNASLIPKININAEAPCDPDKNARITYLNIPLLYDGVDLKFENLDQGFETILKGVIIFILETQNLVLVSALENFLSRSLSNIMCP